MSILRDKQTRDLTSFGGAWQLSDAPTVDFRGALVSKNVEFNTSQVGTRHGFASIGGTAFMNDMYCWFGPFSQINSLNGDANLAYLIYNSGGTTDLISFFNIKRSVAAGSFSNTTAGRVMASMVGIGMRIYVSFADSSQKGVSGASAYTAYNSAGTMAITGSWGNLFPGPMTYTPSAPTEPSAGVVTAGTHRLGYIVEYDSGYTSRVSPDSGATTPPSLTTFTPTSFTAAGSKNLSWVLNPGSWPTGAVYCSIVMTTADNLNQYYIVPGSRTAVPGGSSGSKTFTINISDADLASQAIDATPYLYKFTSSTGGTAPFTPNHIAMWGDRMAYHANLNDNTGNPIACLYISERNDYQTLTADQHLVQLPGQRPIVTSFRMGSLNYIVGPHEIWSVSDTGDVPVSWPAPQLVDGKHGTLAIKGIEVSPSSNYAWVADQNGLYVFTGGPIEALPISYQQTPDWSRINWDAAWCIKVKDHSSAKQVFVMVPLDGATNPTHLMMFDYANGVTWDTVRYSLWNLSGYNLSALEIVRNDLPAQATGNQKKLELWLGSRTAQDILRQTSDLDTNPYRDNGQAINSVWRSPMFPGMDASLPICRHSAMHVRIKGSGSVAPTVYDMDQVLKATLTAQTLATSPEWELLWLMDVLNPLACVEFNTNTLDTHWTLAKLRWYYSPYVMQQ